jgi:hypothetical protein
MLWMTAVVTILAGTSLGHAETINLWGVADGDTAYYEHQSDAFFRMGLVEPGTTQQRFHAISDPSVVFGSASFDGFPNDAAFRLGTFSYDGSGLVGGNGDAPITGLLLGVGADPADSNYVNYGRWSPIDTFVDSFSGTVTVAGGQPVAVDLTSDVHLAYTVSSVVLTAAGQFAIAGNRFDGYLAGDTWSPGDQAIWDFQGTLTTVPEPASLCLLLVGGSWLLRRRRKA